MVSFGGANVPNMDAGLACSSCFFCANSTNGLLKVDGAGCCSSAGVAVKLPDPNRLLGGSRPKLENGGFVVAVFRSNRANKLVVSVGFVVENSGAFVCSVCVENMGMFEGFMSKKFSFGRSVAAVGWSACNKGAVVVVVVSNGGGAPDPDFLIVLKPVDDAVDDVDEEDLVLSLLFVESP